MQPEVIQNMTEFKRGLPLFPLVKPHINFMAAKLWRSPRQQWARGRVPDPPRGSEAILATLIASGSLVETQTEKEMLSDVIM